MIRMISTLEQILVVHYLLCYTGKEINLQGSGELPTLGTSAEGCRSWRVLVARCASLLSRDLGLPSIRDCKSDR